MAVFNIGGPVHPFAEAGGVDQIVGLSAVYSCVRFIADSVASIPINVYRDTTNGPQLIPHNQLLTNPSVDLNTTLYDWLFQCVSSTLLWGNAWGLVSSRTGVTSPLGVGFPQTIEWLPPDQMMVQDDAEQPWNPLKARIYLNGRLMDRNELVHVRAFVIPGRLEAISPLRAFATLYQQGLSALDYSSTWFGNGGFPPGTFQNLAEEVDAEQAREIRRRLTDTLRLHEPLVYGKDWDFKPVVVPPNEAAFIETMQLNATQIAAIYGVPPTKVGGRRGDSLTYATQEQESLGLINDTLRPWLVRMEHLLSSLLPTTQYARFNTDAILKTDMKTRWDIYRVMRDMGAVTIDEVRTREDMAPLPGDLGQETIPLEVMTRMSSTTRAIPKSMVPQLTIEAQMIAGLLQELDQQGLSVPEGPAGAEPTEPVHPNDVKPQPKGPGKAQPQPTSANPPGGSGGTSQSLATPTDKPGSSDATGGGGGYVMGPGNYLGHQLTLGREYLTDRVQYAAGRKAAQIREAAERQVDELQGFFGLKFHRATSKDRQRAEQWLDDAAGAGCLAEDEYEERVFKASKARIKGQLDDLVVDLPPENELAQPQEVSGGPTEPEPGIFGPAALALLQGRNPRLLNGSH